MRINFSELPEKELRLLDALHGMHMQYGAKDKLDILTDKVMFFYGLWDLKKGENTIAVVEKSSELYRAVGKLGHQLLKYEFNPIEGDLTALNGKSVYMLLLLAGLSEQNLKIYIDRGDSESMFHSSMSAGERAFVELQKYGLMITDNRGCGYWTELGHRFIALASHLGSFPPVEKLWFLLQDKA